VFGTARLLIGCCFLLMLSAACDDLRDWKSESDEVFRGEVIGSDGNSQGNSFIRKGFVSHTWLELSFDPGSTDLLADGADGANRATRASRQGEPDAAAIRPAAGSVNTYVCPNGKATCDDAERSAGPFVNTPLVPIDGLTHDPLSQFTFPGGGRLQNYIFGVRFSARSGERTLGRDATLIVSLMQNHRIEVRAMAPSVLAADGMEERLPALFGVFSLEHTAR
jgi:hypothetical protein